MPGWMLFAGVVVLYLLVSKGSSLFLPKGAAVGAKEAKAMMDAAPGLQIVDVRSHGEWGGGHIPGAKLIPVNELDRRAKELDKTKPVFVYCASGMRSASALGILSRNGFSEAKQLAGGIGSWLRAGLPVQR